MIVARGNAQLARRVAARKIFNAAVESFPPENAMIQ
jgi:hypothetical protein